MGFVFFQDSWALIVFELVTVAILTIAGVAPLWALEFFLLTGLLYYISNKSTPMGLLKILLFFMQMTESLASELIPSSLVSPLASVKVVPMAGVECIVPVLADPVNRFLFHMLLPAALATIIVAGIAGNQVFKKFHRATRLWISQRWPSLEGGSTNNSREITLHSAAEGGEVDQPLLLGGESKDITEEEMPPASSGPNEDASQEEALSARMLRAVLFLLFASHFELSNIILRLFRPCEEHFMAKYPWIRCEWSDASGTYAQLMALGLTFGALYILGIPLLFAWLLYRERLAFVQRIGNPSDSHDDEKVTWLDFLHECYHPKFFWFELVWMGRRLLLSLAISVIPTTLVHLQFSLVLLVLGVSFLIQSGARPFKTRLENRVEFVAVLLLILTFSASNFLTQGGQLSAMDTQIAWEGLLVQYGFFVLNAVFVLSCLALAGRPIGALLWTKLLQLKHKYIR